MAALFAVDFAVAVDIAQAAMNVALLIEVELVVSELVSAVE